MTSTGVWTKIRDEGVVEGPRVKFDDRRGCDTLVVGLGDLRCAAPAASRLLARPDWWEKRPWPDGCGNRAEEQLHPAREGL